MITHILHGNSYMSCRWGDNKDGYLGTTQGIDLTERMKQTRGLRQWQVKGKEMTHLGIRYYLINDKDYFCNLFWLKL